MLKQKPRTWAEPDPIEEARLHARSIFSTLKELELARLINDDDEYYSREISEVVGALARANARVVALEAQRGARRADGPK